ncbi:MAG: hypothetical protein Q9191_003020 [Dirinaria sp. TL-2023a]
MSGVGSSVIILSFLSLHPHAQAHFHQGKGDPNKKIQPKAAPSRRQPPSSQTSANVTVDRRTLSHTPQPRPAQQCTAVSPTPTPSNAQYVPTHDAAATIDQTAQNAVSDREVERAETESQSHSNIRVATPISPQPSQRSAADFEAAVSPAQRPQQSSNRAPLVRDSSAPALAGKSTSISASQDLQSNPSIAGSSRHLPLELTSSEPVTRKPGISCAQPAAKRRRIEQLGTSITASRDTAGSGEASLASKNDERQEMSHFQIVVPPPSQVYSQPIRRSPEAAQAAKKRQPRLSAKAKGKQRAIEDTASGNASAGSQRKAAQRRKPRPLQKIIGTQTADEAAREIVAAATTTNKGRRRKRRSVTPENAESVRIVPSKVLMSELTKNLRTGKKSTREAELEEMDQVAKAKRKQQRKDRRNGINQAQDQPSTSDTIQETGEERLERIAREKQASRAVPNTIIVNGQILIDESSLQIDRHAAAAAERDAEQLEAVEENELTRRVNSGTWLKHDKSGGWGELMTDQFYDGLRMFGTDFNMISKMFPGKTRHSVKLKFNKEERDDPRRIEMALKGERVPVDIEEFQRVTNTVFSDPKELEREMEEDKRKIEEEAAAEKAAQDEILKQRADAAAAEAEAAENESSAKENQAGREGEAEAEAKAVNVKEQASATTKRGRHRAGQASNKRKGKEKQLSKKSKAVSGKARSARLKKPLENTTAGAPEA